MANQDDGRGVRRLNLWMRGLLYATGGLFFLAGVQLFVLSGDTATYFAWTMAPPITAAALGGAYFAATIAQFVAARRTTWAEARVAVPWAGAFAVLVLVVTILRFGEFHFSSSDAAPQFAAWLWLATCAGTAVATFLAMWVQLRVPGDDPPRNAPLPRSLRTSFRVETALLVFLGAPFLLVPGVALQIVPYTLSPLATQVIGAGFLGFAVFTYSALRENDLDRVQPVGGLLTVFAILELVTLARYAGDVKWASPLAWIYTLFFASFLPAGIQAWFGPNLFRSRSAMKGMPASTQASIQTPPSGTPAKLTEERPWYRHWPAGVPKSIEYPEICVPELLRRTAQRYPERSALSFFGKSVSYRELDAAVDRFASGLRRIGVRSGDRVSLLVPNTPHFLIAFFGILRAGAIVVQTSPLYTAPELERQFNDAGVETVVAMDLFWPNLAKAKPKTAVKRVVVCDVAEFLKTPLRQLYPFQRRRNLKKAGHWPLNIPDEPWVYRFAELASTVPEPASKVSGSPDDVAVLQYTGGTTGTPKGAMLTHRNLVANAFQGSAWVGHRTKPDRVLAAIPGFHIYGLSGALTYTNRGGELILEPDPRNIGDILKLIQKQKATVFAGVPTMYTALLQSPDIRKVDLRSLQLCYSGGAALPTRLRDEFEPLTSGHIMEAYGMSEVSPALGSLPSGSADQGIGVPYPDTDARILDAADPTRVLPTGEVGELALHGPQVMKGYWNQPEETARVLQDGWFLTGDLARMDEDGFFHIVDRKKDMINASGYKVYPCEVEEVLFRHPAVAEAAVIGVPDAYRGETVKAFVVLKAGASATEQEISTFCRESLAPYKVPKIVEFTRDLPKSLVGKVLRRELRDRERANAKPAS